MNNYQWIWQFIKPNKKRLSVALVFIFISSLLILVEPYLTGILVDKVIGQKQTHLLVPILLTMIGISLLRTAIRYAYQLMFERTGQNTIFSLRQSMYKNCKNWTLTFLITHE